jgi:serine/threonine protein kinase
VLRIGISMLERLKMLHSKNILHRDLKPDNMCIGYDDIEQFYLIDFGLAKYFKD